MATKPLSPESLTVLEQLSRAREDARVNGIESSEYFLDKCGAEDGTSANLASKPRRALTAKAKAAERIANMPIRVSPTMRAILTTLVEMRVIDQIAEPPSPVEIANRKLMRELERGLARQKELGTKLTARNKQPIPELLTPQAKRHREDTGRRYGSSSQWRTEAAAYVRGLRDCRRAHQRAAH